MDINLNVVGEMVDGKDYLISVGRDDFQHDDPMAVLDMLKKRYPNSKFLFFVGEYIKMEEIGVERLENMLSYLKKKGA